MASSACSTSGRELGAFRHSLPACSRLATPGRSRLRPAERQPLCLAAASFPQNNDYNRAISDAQGAVKAALADGAQLIEVEFPTASLAAVAGDGEGVNEMTASLRYLRQFLRAWQNQAPATRVFFPDEKERGVALRGRGMDPGAGSAGVEAVFAQAPFPLGFLTRPNAFLDMGITVGKVNPAEQVAPSDQLLVAAYPHFNVNEILAVEELYQQAVQGTDRAIVVFNGELDRVRSGYYPALFYPKIGALARPGGFMDRFETAYYIHNIKGSRPGALFRCYPGPWQVYRRVGDGMVVVHESEAMPTLKQVALEILPQSDKLLAAKRR